MTPTDEKPRYDFGAAEIERKAARKIRARREGRHSIWFGFGMFGLIGWAVAVPTLIGVALGLWLDEVAPMNFSWTLALIVAGVCLGCWNAWRWVSQERSDD